MNQDDSFEKAVQKQEFERKRQRTEEPLTVNDALQIDDFCEPLAVVYNKMDEETGVVDDDSNLDYSKEELEYLERVQLEKEEQEIFGAKFDNMELDKAQQMEASLSDEEFMKFAQPEPEPAPIEELSKDNLKTMVDSWMYKLLTDKK